VKYSDSLCVYCNTQFAIRFGTVSNRGISMVLETASLPSVKTLCSLKF